MNRSENIISYFAERCKTHPQKAALIYKNKAITYGQLEQDIRQTAAYFASRGIGKGDRVMVFVPMTIGLYRLVLALFHLGAVVVFLDEWVGVKRMEECCKIADCKAFIGGWKIHVLALFSKELKKIPVKLSLSYKKGLAFKQMADVGYEDTALITFTTGSTGAPKAAKRTHGFLKEQFDALSAIIDPAENDTDMPTLPIVLLINLGMGCTSVIPDFKTSKPESMDAGKILEQIEKYKVNRITSSPYFVRKLSEYAIHQSGRETGVKKIFTGGAPVFPDEAAIYLKAFPRVEIKIVYGSTEAEPISVINAGALALSRNRLLNVGKPYKTIAIKIIQITKGPIDLKNPGELDDLTLGPGEIGEIIVAGKHVLKEYYNSPGAYRQNKIVAGITIWHRTGDAGLINSDGELELAGRCNNIIHTGNEIIYPFIFENTCRQIKGIKCGTVLENENVVYAVMELQPNASEYDIYKELKNKYSFIMEVKFLKKMPMDPRHRSKIDYGKLSRILILLSIYGIQPLFRLYMSRV